MAATETWPLIGSWPCSLAVTKDIEVAPEVGLCALALNLSLAVTKDIEVAPEVGLCALALNLERRTGIKKAHFVLFQ